MGRDGEMVFKRRGKTEENSLQLLWIDNKKETYKQKVETAKQHVLEFAYKEV